LGHGECRRPPLASKVRSGVEAEPAHPQQRGADHGNMGQRVRSPSGPCHSRSACRSGRRADEDRRLPALMVHHTVPPWRKCRSPPFLEDPAGVGVGLHRVWPAPQSFAAASPAAASALTASEIGVPGPAQYQTMWRDREIDHRHPRAGNEQAATGRELHAFGEGARR